MTIDKILEEFERKFITEDGDYSYVANDLEASTVKDFIRTFFTSYKEELATKVKGMKFGNDNREGYWRGHLKALDEVLALINQP